MKDAPKKIMNLVIIVGGLAFIFMRLFYHPAPIKAKTKGEIMARNRAPIAHDLNLEDAKKALTDVGGMKEKALSIDTNLRDILQKPPEVMNLERQALSAKPEDAAAPEEEKLVLEGIMIGGESGNLAIISGKVVSEGDMVENAKVLKIEPDRIVLLKNGSKQELKR